MKLIQNRLVADPMMTDAEYLHQKNAERDRAETAGQQPRMSIGKVWVTENAMTRIGALCFIRRREAHHEHAAETFKSLYETRYGQGNPASDLARPMVDSSPVAHDSGMAAKIDRTAAIEMAEKQLGRAAFGRVVALVVLCAPAGDGLSSRPRQRAVDAVLADLERLASIWGMVRRAA